MKPIQLLSTWLEEESKVGAKNAKHAVLSTQGEAGHPHARVVAIREISDEGIIFFTQSRTPKVREIKNCQHVALTFWFERYAREVIIEGDAYFLSSEQNAQYWMSYPQWAQIRFCSYAPISGLAIDSKQVLEDKKKEVLCALQGGHLPCPEDYCGVLIKPKRFVFYTYRMDEFSDVWEFQADGDGFNKRVLSP